LGPTHPPILCVQGDLSPGVEWPESQADHSHPFSAEMKNGELCLHSSIRFNGVVFN
jgi:hypothetical protein